MENLGFSPMCEQDKEKSLLIIHKSIRRKLFLGELFIFTKGTEVLINNFNFEV